MSKIILQQLGVLGLAVIFSILCVTMNSRKPKSPNKRKAKPEVKNSGAF